MQAHYIKILADTDARVAYSLNIQVKEAFAFGGGGFTSPEGLVESKYAVMRMTTAVAAYCNQESAYYHNEIVFQMIIHALDYVGREQHENGLFDLINCNFYSAPDTAFCVKRLLPYLMYLHEKRVGEKEEEIYQRIFYITLKAARGILRGGFHTPNHRWAIASNLMECGHFFGDEEMVQSADFYINEGIDCNEDGEYAEKSAGNYNRINNDAMITLGNESSDESFHEHAIRNLWMMMTYIEPDGSIFTANSTRQDNGMKVYPRDYYLEYLEMGLRYDISEFLDMANYIFDLIAKKQLNAPDHLIDFMNRPEFRTAEHSGTWVPGEFKKLYDWSGILRARRKDYSYTLLREKGGFLYFANRTISLVMKIGGSFCEHREFVPESLTENQNGCQLKQTMRGWYYLPFTDKPETSDWWKMDHGKREKLLGPDLHYCVDVEEIDNGLKVHLKVTGVKNAPLRVELAIGGATQLRHKQFWMPVTAGGYMVLQDGCVVCSNEQDRIEVGPGFGNHTFVNGKFGSQVRSPYAFTLYFTDYTEFEHTFEIRSNGN